MNTPSIWKTIRFEIFSAPTLVATLLLAIAYILMTDIILNYRLLNLVIAEKASIGIILTLGSALFIGSFTSILSEPITLSMFVLNAIFVGLNLVLLFKAFTSLKGNGKVHLSLGGATLFSLVSAGCASCGLSLISVIGLSATLTFLPFHGAELRIISFGLLVVSTWYMLKQLHEAKYCRIN